MENIEETLEDLKRKLLLSKKEKILGILTTADVTNPPFILGSVRETAATIAGTVILRDSGYLDQIIKTFDGVVDLFMVDPEVKNELKNLESLVFKKVKKSKIFVYKPNDFTVDSLDMMAALLFGSLNKKKVLIIGAGNIGSKTTLKLCERGADVFLFDKDKEKVRTITTGLNLIKRSSSSIEALDSADSFSDADLVIGCAPGVPVITKDMVKNMKKDGKIIDAGNRNIKEDALMYAREVGIEVFSLSSLGGYTGMVENYLFQRNNFSGARTDPFLGGSLVVPGVLGVKGDILVDNIKKPSHVYGVCDGVGGLLLQKEGKELIKKYLADNKKKAIIKTVYNLYA